MTPNIYKEITGSTDHLLSEYVQSTNESEWLDLKIGHQDSSPSNACHDNMPYCVSYRRKSWPSPMWPTIYDSRLFSIVLIFGRHTWQQAAFHCMLLATAKIMVLPIDCRVPDHGRNQLGPTWRILSGFVIRWFDKSPCITSNSSWYYKQHDTNGHRTTVRICGHSGL